MNFFPSYQHDADLSARYQALLGVIEAVGRFARSAPDIVRIVHEQAARVLPADTTVLALRQGAHILDIDTVQDGVPFRRRWVDAPHGLTHEVLRDGQVLTGDLFAYLGERGHTPLPINPADDRRRWRSYAGVALEFGGARRGVLAVARNTPHAYAEDDLTFLSHLGRHVALALHNAELHEQVRRLALHDALTGLGNRRAFEGAIEAAVRERPASFALAVIDLDGLKQVNDREGHARGDALLQAFAAQLRARFDDHAYRLGGDEFALVLQGEDEAEVLASSVLEDARQAAHAVRAVFPAAGASVGVARHAAGETAEAVFVRADRAMYEDKARAG